MFKLTINVKAIIHYFLIYLILVGNASAFYVMNKKIFPYFVLIICMFFIYKRRMRIDSGLIIFAAILLFDIIFVRILNSGGIGINLFLDFISKCLLVLTAYEYDKSTFFKRYLKLVVALAIISMVCFLIGLVNINALKSIFSDGYPYMGTADIYYGKFLYVVRPDLRNAGIYSEPGLYQIVLITCLFCLIYIPDRINVSRKFNNAAKIILIVTLITTQSATGYISLGILFAGLIFSKYDLRKKRAFQLIAILLLLLIADYYIQQDNSLLKEYLFDKLSDLGTSHGNQLKTGDARLVIMELSTQIITKHPFGVGVEKFAIFKSAAERTAGAGCGLFYYLAVLGVAGWLAVIWYVLSPAYKYRQDNLTFLVLTAIFLIYTLAQSYILIPSILLMVKIYSSSFNYVTVNNAQLIRDT